MKIIDSLFYQELLIFSIITIRVSGIIGGEPAELYPFFALVMKGDEKCGGTLVADDVVLTAAHCVYFQAKGRWAFPIEIYVLHGDFSSPGGWKLKHHSCERVDVHTGYISNGAAGLFDLALIKLEQSVDVVNGFERMTLSCCNHQKDRRYEYGTVIGLGLTNQNPNRHSTQLMEAELKEDENCGTHKNMIAGQQLCYSAPKTAYMCKGDSGGPILLKEDGKVICIIGISSFIAEDCQNSDFVSTFIPAGLFRNWIKRRTKSLSHHSERQSFAHRLYDK